MHHTVPIYRIRYASFLIIISSLIIAIQFPLALAGINTVDIDGDGYYYDPPSGMPTDPDDLNPCVPDENTEACLMSKDPISAIDDVMGDVESLIASGYFDINSSQAESLLKKLEMAASYIDSGKINVAINNLNAFNNKINAYINSGAILPYDGQMLISQVNNIIDSLSWDYITNIFVSKFFHSITKISTRKRYGVFENCDNADYPPVMLT